MIEKVSPAQPFFKTFCERFRAYYSLTVQYLTNIQLKSRCRWKASGNAHFRHQTGGGMWSQYFCDCRFPGILTQNPWVCSKWCNKVRTSRQKRIVGGWRPAEDGPDWFEADRKATVTQVSTLYNCGELKSISETHSVKPWGEMRYSVRGPQWVPLLSAKSRKLRLQRAQTHQNWTTDDGKNIAWCDETQFLLRHTDGRIRIWQQKHGPQSQRNVSYISWSPCYKWMRLFRE